MNKILIFKPSIKQLIKYYFTVVIIVHIFIMFWEAFSHDKMSLVAFTISYVAIVMAMLRDSIVVVPNDFYLICNKTMINLSTPFDIKRKDYFGLYFIEFIVTDEIGNKIIFGTHMYSIDDVNAILSAIEEIQDKAILNEIEKGS